MQAELARSLSPAGSPVRMAGKSAGEPTELAKGPVWRYTVLPGKLPVGTGGPGQKVTMGVPLKVVGGGGWSGRQGRTLSARGAKREEKAPGNQGEVTLPPAVPSTALYCPSLA